MIKTFLMSNKMRIIYEHINYVRTVSIGIFINVGSRYESKENNGISHFIEHMVFKGTKNKTAKQIAYDIESIGGQINAFTAKEYTCFYARVLDSSIERAFDILSDIIKNPLLNESDIEKEKGVIVEEINTGKDDPEEILYDQLNRLIWKDSKLSFPITGSISSVNKINRKKIISFMEKYYTPSNTVMSIVGNFDEDKLLELSERYFGDWNNSKYVIEKNIPFFNHGIKIKNKNIDQVQFCLAFETYGQLSTDIYKIILISNILGGGMSSRLFQRVREELGLVYSINSFLSTYKDIGAFVIYAAMNPRNFSIVYQEIVNQIKLLLKNKITKEELEVAKKQVKGGIIFGLENTSSRMSNLGKTYLLLEKVFDINELINVIDGITLEDIFHQIEKLFDKKYAIALVGPKKYLDTNILQTEID